MSLENYEGSAIDTSVLQEVQSPVDTTIQTDVVVTADPPTTEVTTPTPPPTEPEPVVTPTEFEIPGVGKLTLEEIKEMKQGNLRQSDYTKKTQELARQREELQNADNLFNYLKQNPHLVEAMKNAENNPNSVINTATSESEAIRKLAYNQKAFEVDIKLNDLKARYGEIDEVALFKKANELGTDDLEFVYKGIRYEDKPALDVQSIIDKAKADAKAELKAELEANRGAVQTTVDTRQTAPVNTVTPLTADERRVAQGMGMTEDEYRKWL